MQFNLNEEIQDLPLKELRRLFRKQEYLRESTFEEHFALTTTRAKLLVQELVAKGLISRAESQQELYQTTNLGKRLAASAVRRISNAKAKALMQSFLQRVAYLNSEHSEFAYRVNRVVLTGSFLNENLPDYGDIDLFVDLIPKYPRGSEDQKRLEAKRTRLRSNFPNIVERLFWPVIEVRKFLKAKSRYLSIEDDFELYQQVEPKDAFRLIYQKDEFPT